MEDHEIELERFLEMEYPDEPESRKSVLRNQYGIDIESQDYQKQQRRREIDQAFEQLKEPTIPDIPIEPRIKEVKNDMEIIKVHDHLDEIVRYIDPKKEGWE